MPSRQPLLASTSFMYVESDIPEGMSLDAWRRRGNADGPASLAAGPHVARAERLTVTYR